MKEAWPVPETAAPIDPEMANQVLSTVRKEHVKFTEDDSDDDETVRTLFGGKQSGDGVDLDLDDIDDVRPSTGKRKWKKAIKTTDEDVVDWKKEMQKSAKKLMTAKSSKKRSRVVSEIIAYQAMDAKTEKVSDKVSQYPHTKLPDSMKDSWEYGKANMDPVSDFIDDH